MTAVLDSIVRTGHWRIDPLRSTVGFSVRHFGVTTVHGRFASAGGEIVAGAHGVRIGGHVDVASIDTGNAMRDARLRWEFFDAERYATIAFTGRLTAVDGRPAVVGELRIRGVIRPVALEVTARAIDDATVALRATGEISRSDFGLEWEALREAGRLVVADRVRITADVVGRRAGEPADIVAEVAADGG